MNRRMAAALVCGLLAGSIDAVAQARFDFDSTPGQLPKSVLPLHHALTLTLDPDAESFSGEATLTLRVREPVAAIVLNARELTSSSAALAAGAGAPERVLAVQPGSTPETWRLVPHDGAPIAAGEHRLRLAWSGRVQRNGTALFRVPHRALGRPATMLATQSAAVYARLLFPGFDEPAFRAVFEVAVRAPAGLEVLSNMPAQGDPVDEGAMRLHRFAPTPSMPSYLVAIAVGRFDSLAGSAAGVPLRILTAPGKGEQGAYAMSVTQAVLPWFNDYFGVPYALPKLDQLAVPGVRGGAMEDWGLISYVEDTLLFDPARSDANRQRTIFAFVAHEIAHQWFGNLVTAASWEEIWLNEAFATWMARKAMHHFNPAWQMPLRRRRDNEGALARDAGPATRAIRSGAVAEARVWDVFDDITYRKGGAVLAMLEAWMGPDDFRRGLAAYMAERRLSNATAGDLWHHLGRAAGRDVSAVATSWTDQPGFPLLSVKSSCTGGRTVLELAQQRFRTNGRAADTARWRVPVVALHGARLHSTLLEDRRQRWTLPGCPAQPTLLNPNGDGFYRVAYAAAERPVLARRFAQLPGTAQAMLLSDTFALAQAGALPLAEWLALVAALPTVQGPARAGLYEAARGHFEVLHPVLHGTPAAPALDAAARELFGPALASLGWHPRTGEDSEDESLRNALIRALARHGDSAVVRRAEALFDADAAGRTPLPPGIRAGVATAVGRGGDAARFTTLLERMEAADNEEDRWLYASAASATPDAALMRRLLALSIEGKLPFNLAVSLPRLVSESVPAHSQLAYAHVVANWMRLAELLGSGRDASRAALLPRTAGAAFVGAQDAARLRADQQRLAPGLSPVSTDIAIAQIELRAAIRAREAARLPAALSARR
jgi:aminopeptidase N